MSSEPSGCLLDPLGESDDHPVSFLLVVNKGEPLPENQKEEREQASRPEALSVREVPFKK